MKLCYLRNNAHHVTKEINLELQQDIMEEEALTAEENDLLEGESVHSPSGSVNEVRVNSAE